MKPTAQAIAAATVALLPLWSCAPAPPAAARKPAAIAPAPPPAPAKRYTMVCRNSQNGLKAECGTPNAVMVGLKEQK